jgi:iron complex outermembrane receptor protein
LRGGPNVESETANDLEVGYRGQWADRVSLSSTVFRTVYGHLRTQEIDPTFTYIYYANGMHGATSGIETWGSVQVVGGWRLHAGFSRLRQDFALQPWSNDSARVKATAGVNPPFWWVLRSTWDIGPHAEFDLFLRHVAALADPAVSAYTSVNLRYGWQPRPDLDVSLLGANLGSGGHGEFADVSTRTYFKPEVLLNLAYHF